MSFCVDYGVANVKSTKFQVPRYDFVILDNLFNRKFTFSEEKTVKLKTSFIMATY